MRKDDSILYLEKLNNILVSEIENIHQFNVSSDITSLNKTIDKFDFEHI